MAKQSLIEQLDQALEVMLAGSGAALPRVDASLAPLLRIAAELRDLPSEKFKTHLDADLKRRTSMATTAVQPIPEGYRAATPYLSVKDAARAIEFYKKAFGATEVMRLAQADGRIGHAEIRIGAAVIMLADEFPEIGFRGPESLGGSPVRIHLYVDDVDALARQALAAGAKAMRPVTDQFYGDRSGTFVDPFGHTWIIATRKEHMSTEEMHRRFDDLGKQEETKKSAVRPIRKGFHTITPYLRVQDAPGLIDFVKQTFGAEESLRAIGPAGGIHAEVRIGNSMLMIGGGGPGLSLSGAPMPTGLHVYVPDCDAAYERALRAGATSLQGPVDQFYGERSASVKDAAGNHWYIAFPTYLGAKQLPEDLQTVQAYLHPLRAEPVINFLKRAFRAEELGRHASPDGVIHHVTVKIGDSTMEMGEAHGPYQPMPTAIYLYVNDVDAVYECAVQAGATSLYAPVDQPYGDRNAGVQDSFGNHWYIARHDKEVPV